MTEGHVHVAAGVHRSFADLRTVLAGAGRGPVRVRYCHQPNMLASLAVLTPCVAAPIAASCAGRPGDCAVTWVSVDYDAADDEQLFRVRLPRTHPVPGTRMTPALGRRWAGRRLASSIASSAALSRVPELEQEVVNAALALRHDLAGRGWAVTSRRTCRRRVAEGFAALRHALGSHRRLTDALAGHNTWMVEQVFGVSAAVRSGTDWLLARARWRLRALLLVAGDRPDLLKAGTWRVCPRCHVRSRIQFRFGTSDMGVVGSSCLGCGRVLGPAPLDLTATVDSPAGPCPEYLLPVQLDDVLERLVEPGFDLAVHYPGSFVHLAASRAALLPLLNGALSGYPEPAPDWCPTHLELTSFVDILLRDGFSPRPKDADDARAFHLLYRSSALVCWSVLAGSATAAAADHPNGPDGEGIAT
ncbi:hypothetical protein ACGF5C_09060 [Micromonospora sp. NPDC047620]|uniref:hypothetical protein n=1 Tax=Micromonospora sp. NPDC047620 TaxID=3364251 RepID=UPI00371AE9D3